MSKKSLSLAFGLLVACISLSNTGCVHLTYGNSLGILAIPIPVSPYTQKVQEDRFWENERYNTVPILGPITAGGPTTALDEPSDDEIMRAFERANPVQGGLPLLHEIQRNNVRIVKEKIADYVDPPRVIPLIGPAQLHHAHYKCTIYYTEITRVGWPVPYTTRDEEAIEVIYIDHNHFHMVGNPDTGMTGTY
ncbi:MAG: hypothetical protein KJ000_31035 [Pirellulaceae bacterium]|jgi:hypothetical protein|nr:hypothetical protein [Pirellulaceae bacterium]